MEPIAREHQYYFYSWVTDIYNQFYVFLHVSDLTIKGLVSLIKCNRF
jgi:hypothetical protein